MWGVWIGYYLGCFLGLVSKEWVIIGLIGLGLLNEG